MYVAELVTRKRERQTQTHTETETERHKERNNYFYSNLIKYNKHVE